MDHIACCNVGATPQKTNVQPFKRGLRQGAKYDWKRLGQCRTINNTQVFQDKQASMIDFEHESYVQFEAFKHNLQDQECFWRDTRFKCFRKPMRLPKEQAKKAQPVRDQDIILPAKRTREKQVLEFNGVKYTVIKALRYKV
jgi:hypothetical protein